MTMSCAGSSRRSRPFRRILAVCLLPVLALVAGAQTDEFAGFDEADEGSAIRDPVAPVNRGIYVVNDTLYFWIVKPLATGYAKVLPEGIRDGVGNVFDNLGMPRRGVNCLLQGNLAGLGDELGRFLINSTVGVLGFCDVAARHCGLEAHPEDFGQTLGVYGVGDGLYLTLPIFGPSNPRDTVGLVADAFLDPVNYVVQDLPLRLGIRAGDRVNHTSLHLGDYEKSKETALDHYVWLRESYTQYRDEQIRRR